MSEQESGLYTLVTDHTFAHEEAVVWEKLDDIEGSLQFVDAEFRTAAPVGGDFAGETAESIARMHDRYHRQENLSTEERQECVIS
jgi:ubiquitin carboxyl-terminal hydrolase MINDY-1/2